MSTGPEAVAEAHTRRTRTDPWLRAFTAPVPAPVRTGSGRSHGIGSRAGGPKPCEHGREAPRGALDGMPVAVKGRWRLGGGAPAVRRLLAAGAVPIGTTSVPRGPGYQTWGATDRGPTRNPWRGDRSPGGSSAGSAAAVGAGIVPLATGSDGAGSVRIPAAWCGIIGYRPTSGLVPSTDPTGLATPGVLVRDPALLRPWLDAVTTGPVPAGSGSGAGSDAGFATAAWSDDLGFAARELDPDVVGIARAAAADLLRAAGAAAVDVPLRLHDPAPAWTALRHPDAGPAAVRAAHELRAANDRALRAFFARADLLLTPTTPAGPHGHDGPGGRMSVALTWAFNLSGHPAVSVPAGFGPDGCPVGLQMVARHGADEALLDLVAAHVPVARAAPF
ncbi:hypothetical protein AD006_17030 [Pseudonocardia sp. EC080610-09]|nr:hypothetical protein AD006_17030 [Pseudonocardia sp. EC080610-09]ALL83620.1 hypothetical protein AD017_24865 [Pseudonocardia sp. EC080619-01]